jgi:hypothetical protein
LKFARRLRAVRCAVVSVFVLTLSGCFLGDSSGYSTSFTGGSTGATPQDFAICESLGPPDPWFTQPTHVFEVGAMTVRLHGTPGVSDADVQTVLQEFERANTMVGGYVQLPANLEVMLCNVAPGGVAYPELGNRLVIPKQSGYGNNVSSMDEAAVVRIHEYGHVVHFTALSHLAPRIIQQHDAFYDEIVTFDELFADALGVFAVEDLAAMRRALDRTSPDPDNIARDFSIIHLANPLETDTHNVSAPVRSFLGRAYQARGLDARGALMGALAVADAQALQMRTSSPVRYQEILTGVTLQNLLQPLLSAQPIFAGIE